MADDRRLLPARWARRGAGAAVTGALVLACSAPALAAPAVLRLPRSEALAVGGDQLVWARLSGAQVLIRARPLAGGDDRTLATLARLHPSSRDVAIHLAASAGGWIAAVEDVTNVDADPENERLVDGLLVVRGGLAGDPVVLASCRPPRQPIDQPVLVAASAGRVAFSGARCGATGANAVAADGAVQHVGDDAHPDAGPQLAGRFLAYRRRAPDAQQVRVVDLEGGALSYVARPPAGTTRSFALADDGTVVIGTDHAAGNPMFQFGPTAPAPRRLRGLTTPVDHGLSPEFPPDYLIGAGRIVFGGLRLAAGRLGVPAGPLDGDLSPLGMPGAGLPGSLVTFDGDRVALLSRACSDNGAQLVVLTLADPATPGSPGCPIQVRSRTVVATAAGVVKLAVSCPNGCSGPFALTVGPGLSAREITRYVDAEFDQDLARGTLRLPPGNGIVRLRLNAAARRFLARHHGRLTTLAYVAPSDTSASQLGGAYTVVVRSGRRR